MTDAYQVAVIPGDGVGPEVIAAAVAVLKAGRVPVDFTHFEAGDDCQRRHGVALPDETREGALAADAVLFGTAGETAAEVVIGLRRALATHVNLRPVRSFAGVEGLYPDVDLVIVRENSEGLYGGIEAEIAPGVATATRVITERASTAIARFAFDYARGNGYGKVTAIHKANVLRTTDGLFLRCVRDVAEKFSDVFYSETIVDAAALYLVTEPQRFEVIVTTNLFGDILSDLAAGLVGGLGLCPSANLGDEHALFEPVHGTAPDIAGQGIANPTAAILCGAMLARHLGCQETGERIERALEATLASGETTPDLGGSRSTMEMTEAVISHVKEDAP